MTMTTLSLFEVVWILKEMSRINLMAIKWKTNHNSLNSSKIKSKELKKIEELDQIDTSHDT